MESLQTDRLVLRPAERNDLDFLQRLYGDPVVMRYYDIGEPYDPGHVEAMVEFDIEQRKHTGWGSWAIVEKGSGRPIGHGGFERHSGLGAMMLYYLLVQTAWGKGYATEFARRAIRHGFEDLGFDRIQATAHPGNAGSIRVLEKAGMQFVRYLPDLVRNLYAIDRLAIPR